MDETRLRAVVREEIALAMKTLGEVADRNNNRDDSDDTDALYAIETVTNYFGQYAYEGACEKADEKRARDAANPFEEPEPDDAVDPAVKALVHAEVLGVLKNLRSAFYMSGLDEDYRIAERLDGFITARETDSE